VIVSTLVLRLKGAESFLETSQCTYKTGWMCRKIRITRCEEKISSGIGEDPY